MTQAELADALGVSQARISKIEHGEISGIDVVRAYVAALGGSIDVVARLGDRSWKVWRRPREHLAQYGTTSDRRLFRGEGGGLLSDSIAGRVWERARQAAAHPAEAASPLAERPYAGGTPACPRG